MSGIATGWAWRKVKLGDPIAKSILAALADNADDNGRCFPSQKNLAEKSEYSVSTVKRKLKLLEKFSVIEIHRKREGSRKTRNYYRLRIELEFDLRGILEGVTVTPLELLQAGGVESSGVLVGQELEGVTQTPLTNEGVTENPITGSDRHLALDPSVRVTPLKGSQVNPETSFKPQISTTNNNTQVEGVGIDSQSKVTLDLNWKPNEYLAQGLKMNFGIPVYFIDDTLFSFLLNHQGKTKRQGEFEKMLASWIRKDWQTFGKKALEQNYDEGPKPISRDWEPTDDVYSALLEKGISRSTAEPLVREFKVYWRDHGGARPSFGSLFITYAGWKSTQAGNRAVGVVGPAGSKMANLTDRSWAG